MASLHWRYGLGLLMCMAWSAGGAATEPLEAIRLREDFSLVGHYHVSTRVELQGTLHLPAGPNYPARTLELKGTSAIDYDERILTYTRQDGVQKTVRRYRRIDFQRQLGDQPQQSTVRPAVRRLVLQRRHTTEVAFSPDGPLTWGELDLLRTDVFTPALAGLLPDQAVRPGQRWQAATVAVQELTDLEQIEEGTVECRFDQVETVNQRRQARISFSGTVRGVNEDGPSRQRLQGYLFFDLQSNHLSYLYLNGSNWLLDKDGKPSGTVEGRFVLTRQAGLRCAELEDKALSGVDLEPGPENTRLLYENAEVGLSFLYPRRWRIAAVHGLRLTLEDGRGNGLLLTAETPDQAPTMTQLLAEVRGGLAQQKLREHRADPPRRLQGPPAEIDHVRLHVSDAGGTAWSLDYFLVRQPAGCVILAARLAPPNLAILAAEVEGMARSVRRSGRP